MGAPGWAFAAIGPWGRKEDGRAWTVPPRADATPPRRSHRGPRALLGWPPSLSVRHLVLGNRVQAGTRPPPRPLSRARHARARPSCFCSHWSHSLVAVSWVTTAWGVSRPAPPLRLLLSARTPRLQHPGRGCPVGHTCAFPTWTVLCSTPAPPPSRPHGAVLSSAGDILPGGHDCLIFPLAKVSTHFFPEHANTAAHVSVGALPHILTQMHRCPPSAAMHQLQPWSRPAVYTACSPGPALRHSPHLLFP